MLGSARNAALTGLLFSVTALAMAAGPKAGRARVLNALTVVLAIATLLRMLAIVLPRPITGYANNLDFYRQSSCVGVWQYYADYPAVTDHRAGPVNDLIRDGRRIGVGCFHSSDNLFLWVASRFAPVGSHFGLRRIGILRSLVAALLMVVALAQPVGPGWRTTIALAFLLTFGDIAMATYFNTLYVDPSAIIFGSFVALMAITVLVGVRVPGWGSCVALALALMALGTVKPQTILLTLVFGLGMAFVMWRQWGSRGRAMLLALPSVGGPVLLVALNMSTPGHPHMLPGMYRMNRNDTVLGAILPAATDKPAALASLGLAPSCRALIGKNDYFPEAHDHHTCTTLEQITTLQLLRLFLSQPSTIVAPVMKAIARSRPAYLADLNHFERPADAALPWFRVLHGSSLSSWLMYLAAPVYLACVGALFLVGPALGLLIAGFVAKRGSVTRWRGAVPIAVGGVVVFYAVTSAVFGDGFVEVPRHQALVVPGIAIAAAGLARIVARAAMRQARQEGLLF